MAKNKWLLLLHASLLFAFTAAAQELDVYFDFPSSIKDSSVVEAVGTHEMTRYSKAASSLLYFRAATRTQPIKFNLFRTDGTANGTFQLTDFPEGDFVNYTFNTSNYWKVLGDRLFFVKSGRVWHSDGTVSGTFELTVPNLPSTAVIHPALLATPTHVYFTANVNCSLSLYSIDQSLVIRTCGFAGYSGGVADSYWKAMNGKLVFFSNTNPCNDLVKRWGLFVSDGDAGSTQLLKEWGSNTAEFTPASLYNVNDDYLLLRWLRKPLPYGDSREYLAKIKMPFVDIDTFYTINQNGPDGLSSVLFPSQNEYTKYNVGPIFIFSGYTINNKWEMWRTDGNFSGTYMIKQISSSANTGVTPFAYLFSTDSRYVFKENNVAFSTTGMMNSMDTFSRSTDPLPKSVEFSINKGRFTYFVLNKAIWKSDGTAANTTVAMPSFWPHNWQIYHSSVFDIVGNQLYHPTVRYKGTTNEKYSYSKQDLNFVSWTGNASASFFDPSNWDNLAVPGITDKVIIPSGRPFYPRLTQNYQIKKLVMHGGSATIAPGNRLTLGQ